jgi:predicted lipid-binding transport protein (Tim44 family)
MGPVAGLAAGLGLAALASHLGLGEEFANMLMVGLLVMGVLMAISYFMRRRTPAPAPRAPVLQYAATGSATASRNVYDLELPAGSGMPAAAATTGHIPADFDEPGFLRNAKVGFIRLQAANDTGDLEDIRAFTSPEVFAEIKMNIVERGQQPQQTDVLDLAAELLEVTEEAGRYIASVHFSGLIREDKDAAPEPFAEVWHVARPLDGQGGWIVLGIQQVQ